MHRWIFLITSLFSLCAVAQSSDFFDAHVHYNLDAQQKIPPEVAIEVLRKAGITQALVSSTGNDGTQKLLELAPDLIVPALRPYRRPRELRAWVNDPSVPEYLESQLMQYDYRIFGEFHAFERDILTPVVQEVLKLAKAHDLILHHHGDRKALDLIYDDWPEARILWAHGGFEEPEYLVDALERYPRLWVDLSMRTEISTWAGLNPEWERLFKQYPQRFTLGSDTFTLERWSQVELYTQNTRDWLSVLPEETARLIAYENAKRLLLETTKR